MKYNISNFTIMENEIINKVAQSHLITLNPVDLFPASIIVFDLKDFLFMELILKEKEFRESLKTHNWKQYTEKSVILTCSADAIIPLWAYMLVTTYLQPYAKAITSGDAESAKRELFHMQVEKVDFEQYRDKRIVLKGCGDEAIPEYAYVTLTDKLLPYVKSIMYGEPCSTVPVFKRK